MLAFASDAGDKKTVSSRRDLLSVMVVEFNETGTMLRDVKQQGTQYERGITKRDRERDTGNYWYVGYRTRTTS